MKKKIIVPVDFTAASEQATRQAELIAGKSGSAITLFHVTDEGDLSSGGAGDRLKAEAEKLSRNGIPCETIIAEGSVLDLIVRAVCEKDFDMMVIGTHGYRSLRQKIFGADILKLVSRIPVPVLVVQEDSPLAQEFSRIVLPVGSHDHFNLVTEAAVMMAEIYNKLEVHLYSIQKPGLEWPAKLLENIAQTVRILEEAGVALVRIKEDQDGFSQGFAWQTLRYAQSVGAEAIAIMSVASEEYYFMSKTYKEAILLNENRIPVLCAGGGSVS